MTGVIKEISSREATEFLLPKHYSGRKPQITKAFGWFDNQMNLKAVCTFGKPASNSLCKGLLGGAYSTSVYELNRLCRTDDWGKPLSWFVATCLRRLRPLNWVVVSYSDMAMNHHGYIYQACNFLYTGCTKGRTDLWAGNGKHSRHYIKGDNRYRVVRSQKHRYVYFCTNSKRLKKEWMEALRYPVMEYPKGDNNKDYVLGEYLKPVIIEVNNL